MEKPDRLYHGSTKLIEGYIEPRKALDEMSENNSQLAVYATDRFEVATGMSLTGDNWSFADFDEPDFKVLFAEEPPESDQMRYVYELSSETFERDPENKSQWISFEKVKILEMHKFRTQDLSHLWRMATKEEVDAHTPKNR
ncbi:hypothetical protein COV06_00330 [Candidatus Uhrbacteria bacterium CG10_big_fil_rev_8_21_14_0_10_50_16]|uniref:Uncharacterized protein n=1 Tax=Candidatus Uhrbacteria bacterium CG10_big_fil_rev_8_21_14_0_10_50_16 TaxID=1975039 RepID=A0A2H0RN10_9BACT|nr:MAG: hypothetical protein COV06_00330 [Candidatus Uhrbacteria bacterium CG10_big_fil_rev_8_21_14_0_10_50_16]